MEKQDNHQQPPYHDASNSTDFNISQVKAYTIRPSRPDDGHDGWVVEIKFNDEQLPAHKILGPTPKDVLDKLMRMFT